MTEERKYIPTKEEREANVEKAKAEARKANAEALKAEREADLGRLILEREERKEKDELATDHHFHVYVFDKEVTEASVKACIKQLTIWSRQDPKCDIELHINSPGGAIFDGFALIDFLRDLSRKGHYITTIGIGMVASMGGVIFQAGDKRIMGRHAYMLIHEGSFGAIGDFGKVEDRVKLMELFHERILDLFISRAKPLNPKITKSWLKRQWRRTDLWLPSEKVLEYGFADEVA